MGASQSSGAFGTKKYELNIARQMDMDIQRIDRSPKSGPEKQLQYIQVLNKWQVKLQQLQKINIQKSAYNIKEQRKITGKIEQLQQRLRQLSNSGPIRKSTIQSLSNQVSQVEQRIQQTASMTAATV